MLIKIFGHSVSRVIARYPSLLFRTQELWLRIGYKFLDMRMASWVVRRPEWLRQKSQSKIIHLEPALPDPVSVNLALAERTIEAFQESDEKISYDLVAENTIWGNLRQAHYSKLRSLVVENKPAELAEYQSRLFRSEAVNGYTYGSTFNSVPHRWHYLPIQIELSVVQLAEAIGILRAECHEQGLTAYWRKLMSEEELIGKLEQHFGFRIEQPRKGDPTGMMFGGRFLTRETCSHLHSAYKMKAYIDRYIKDDALKIVEIGGGFGGTCYWLHKVLPNRVSRYAIVDLPEVSLVQAYFLGSTLPDSLVMRGETAQNSESTINLVPHFNIDEIDFEPNILINQDSMPEMPESEVERYLGWAAEWLNGIFLSFNQETYSPTPAGLQISVPEKVADFKVFRRMSRETSWDRRGYVEEVYLKEA